MPKMSPSSALALLKSTTGPPPSSLAKHLGMTLAELVEFVGGEHQFNKAMERERERAAPATRKSRWPSHEDLVERLNAGETQVAIAAEIGVSGPAVNQYLKRHGLDARLRSGQERRSKRLAAPRRCVDCGDGVSTGATRCRDCSAGARATISWPEDDALVEMVVGLTLNQAAIKLRISRASIRERLKRRFRWKDVLRGRRARSGR